MARKDYGKPRIAKPEQHPDNGYRGECGPFLLMLSGYNSARKAPQTYEEVQSWDRRR